MFRSNLKFLHDIDWEKVIKIMAGSLFLIVLFMVFKPKSQLIEDTLFVVTQKDVITNDKYRNPYLKYLTVVNYMGENYDITEYRIFEMLEPFYHQSVTCKFKITRFLGYEWIKVLGVTE